MRYNTQLVKKYICPLLVVGLSLAVFPSLAIGGWSDWWQTPDQRALKLYESGKNDELIESSPNDNWTALGKFQEKNYQEAAASFAKTREALQADAQTSPATTALYNQGVSDVLSGQYEQAIEHFEQVLAEDPAFVDAEHNRDIAQQLLELEQNPEDSQNQDGEQGEQGDENSESSDSEQSSEGSDGEQSDSSEGESESKEGDSDSESDSEQDGSASDENSEQDAEQDSASKQQQQEEEQQARDALAAEAEQQEQQDQSGTEQQMMEQLVESEEPLTESEQATEQILRRIPDDPRGLLRRKLEQSHRNEFPEVGDALEAW